MTPFLPFDPLAPVTTSAEAQAHAVKREIRNVLRSYVGWFDPFSESLQNALDSVETRASIQHGSSYNPSIWITINLEENTLSVTDNGIGLTQSQFLKFLAPNFL